jgi:hypothetical protein
MVLCIDFRFPDESKQIEVTDESNDQLTLLKCDGTLFVHNQRELETTFNIANLHGVQVLDARKHSSGKRHMIIMLKGEDGYGEFLCEAFSAPPQNITPHAIPQNITKEEAIHSKINRKRDQLDDLTRETAEILEKRPRITPRIRRYQDLIGMIQPLYEEVETEDAGIIQNCIDEINAKYEAEFDEYTAAKNKTDAALYRVKQIEAKITDELGLLTAVRH